MSSAAYVKHLAFKCITLYWLQYFIIDTVVQIPHYSKEVASRGHQRWITIHRTMAAARVRISSGESKPKPSFQEKSPILISVRVEKGARILVTFGHSLHGTFGKVKGWPRYEMAVLVFQTYCFHQGTVPSGIWLVILMPQDPKYSSIAWSIF